MSRITAEFSSSLAFCRDKNEDDFSRYYDDPVGFAHEVIGQETWSGQEGILLSAAQSKWVTVRSGHRVSKTNSAAILALWFVLTRGPASRCIITGPSAGLLHKGLWREIRALHLRCKARVGGHAGVIAATGINWPDTRQIIGITADQSEGFQGLAAAEIMFIADEASGVHDRIFEAMIGNLAGGGHMLLIGNPTKSYGFFFDSHKSQNFARIHLSSHDSPNVTESDPKKHVKGLATLEWLDLCAKLWGGTESVLYRIRCKGEFVESREGRMITPDMIAEAEARYDDTEPSGRLFIGIDPAGEGGDGDASGFACRRGKKAVHLETRRGMSADVHVAHTLGLISVYKGDSREPTLVVIDRDGLIGHKVYSAFLNYLLDHQNAYELIGIRGSENAKRRPLEIDNVRDELWFALADAFIEGLAIPAHSELSGDLSVGRFYKLVNGRAKVAPKDQMRRELGRSPDLADALCLACYVDFTPDVSANEEPPPPPQLSERVHEHRADRMFDPYAALDAWRSRA